MNAMCGIDSFHDLTDISAPSGRNIPIPTIPGALPRAIAFCPVGAAIPDAPRGHHGIAQGKAKRRPGSRRPLRYQALKGRNAGSGRPQSGSAPSGRDIMIIPKPKAVPWAIAFRPVGADAITIPRSKAMPWAVTCCPVGVLITGRSTT